MDTRSESVTICGRTVIVRPFRFFDLATVERLFAQMDEQSSSPVSQQLSTMTQIFALALRMPHDDFAQKFEGMEVAEALELLDKIRAVNEDFFAQQKPGAVQSQSGKSRRH